MKHRVLQFMLEPEQLDQLYDWVDVHRDNVSLKYKNRPRRSMLQEAKRDIESTEIDFQFFHGFPSQVMFTPWPTSADETSAAADERSSRPGAAGPSAAAAEEQLFDTMTVEFEVRGQPDWFHLEVEAMTFPCRYTTVRLLMKEEEEDVGMLLLDAERVGRCLHDLQFPSWLETMVEEADSLLSPGIPCWLFLCNLLVVDVQLPRRSSDLCALLEYWSEFIEAEESAALSAEPPLPQARVLWLMLTLSREEEEDRETFLARIHELTG